MRVWRRGQLRAGEREATEGERAEEQGRGAPGRVSLEPGQRRHPQATRGETEQEDGTGLTMRAGVISVFYPSEVPCYQSMARIVVLSTYRRGGDILYSFYPYINDIDGICLSLTYLSNWNESLKKDSSEPPTGLLPLCFDEVEMIAEYN